MEYDVEKETEWSQRDVPWLEIEPSQLIDILLDRIDFLDILDECGVEYWAANSGEFTHKMRCPLPIHDFGGERTPSMFVNVDKNSFYCFGCNSGNNLVDFISQYKKMPFLSTLKYLYQRANIRDGDLDDIESLPKRRKKDPEEMTATHVFRAGILIRNHVNKLRGTDSYVKWCQWADKQFLRLDSYLDEDNLEKSKQYCAQVVEYMKAEK